MADNRKEYVVTIGGIEHTMLLNDEDAKGYGEAAKLAPANNARQAENKA